MACALREEEGSGPAASGARQATQPASSRPPPRSRDSLIAASRAARVDTGQLMASRPTHVASLGPLEMRPLRELQQALKNAASLDIAVAYAKSSGVERLLALRLPPSVRVIVGLG